MSKLKPEETRALLKELAESLPHDACLTCECFLGYVAQLRIESEAECKEDFAPYKARRETIHKCLGCAPCPPGNLYAALIRKKQTPPLITL